MSTVGTAHPPRETGNSAETKMRQQQSTREPAVVGGVTGCKHIPPKPLHTFPGLGIALDPTRK